MGSREIQLMIERTVKCRVSATTFGVFRVGTAAKEEGVPRGYRRAASSIELMHRMLVSQQVQAREVLRDLGLPYRGEDGWYIMPHEHINEFAKRFSAIKKEFQLQLNQLHASAASVLGEAPNPVERIVSADLMVRAYTLNFKLHDYPACAFAGMAPERATVLAGRVNVELAGLIADCRLEAVQRVATPVLHLVERIKAIGARHEAMARGEGVGKSGVLRESALGQAQEAVRRLPAFNFADDPEIAALHNDGADILALDAADLRANPETRAHALELCTAYHAKVQRLVVALTHQG